MPSRLESLVHLFANKSRYVLLGGVSLQCLHYERRAVILHILCHLCLANIHLAIRHRFAVCDKKIFLISSSYLKFSLNKNKITHKTSCEIFYNHESRHAQQPSRVAGDRTLSQSGSVTQVAASPPPATAFQSSDCPASCTRSPCRCPCSPPIKTVCRADRRCGSQAVLKRRSRARWWRCSPPRTYKLLIGSSWRLGSRAPRSTRILDLMPCRSQRTRRRHQKLRFESFLSFLGENVCNNIKFYNTF